MNKTCKICDISKPLTEFHIVKKTGRPNSYCRPCNTEYARRWRESNPDRMEEIRCEWDTGNPDYNKEYLKRPKVKEKRVPYYRKYKLQKYGLTEELYQKILTEQGDRCAICKAGVIPHGKKTHTDHCHKTGRVRGILCPPCNQGLGWFRDDPVRLTAAITYLKCS